MTVRDAIEKTGYLCGDVEYRTNCFLDGKENDIWTGACYYNGESLIPYDDDSYSLDDEIVRYEFFDSSERKMLTVWYESKWETVFDHAQMWQPEPPKMIDKIRQMSIEEMANFLIIEGEITDEDEAYDGSMKTYSESCYYTPFGVIPGWKHREDVVEEVIENLLAEDSTNEN